MKSTLFIISLLLLFFACTNKEEKKDSESGTSAKTISNSYSAAFNEAVNNTLNAYYNLKDAFVASDTAKANLAAVQLKLLLDSLKLDEMKSVDSIGFQNIVGRPGDVASEITGMLGENELEKKRESFEMISNAFYDMMRVIKPAGATIYYQYCPMAFNDKGAYWLSNKDSIRNPYFGKKMLTCGEVKETLNY